MDDQNKNLILATVLSFVVLFTWFMVGPMLFPNWFPQDTAQQSSNLTAAPSDVVAKTDNTAPAASQGAATPAPSTATGTGAAPTETLTTKPQPKAPRLTLDTPSLSGSISMLGGRFDELSLKKYRQTSDPNSPIVDLLSPEGSKEPPYYAVFGWQAGAGVDPADVPGPSTMWQIASGGTLAPGHPVTLRWDNGKGLVFTRAISVDDNYMFKVTDAVQNNGAAKVNLAPYGIIARHGLPKLLNYYIVHEGVLRRVDGDLQQPSYSDMTKLPDFEGVKGISYPGKKDGNGWIGFTDHYWMTTLIPTQGQPWTAVEKYTPGADIYQTEVRQPLMSVAPGATAQSSMQLFAGAKVYEILKSYQDHGIGAFVDSIDWGWFFFLTKPIFLLLHWLHGIIGNMGLAIIALTFVLKLLVLPLAYRSYVSMARMKELQPEMEDLKARCGEDKQRLQREMMQLYKEKKVNPAAGCLPILPQIPIFFSLYKVIFVTIELRQAPFFGWLKDLSQPDPSSLLNLFGLLPFQSPPLDSTLHSVFIGLLPILLGISMWLQQKLNPAPTDPIQGQIMTWMPWVFMFMLGRFASGLVLYWITNNTITFSQQYLIMWSHGKRPDIFGNIREARMNRKYAKAAKVLPSPPPGKAKKPKK